MAGCGSSRIRCFATDAETTVSTLTPDLLEEIALTINLGERLTLIIVFGPGYLAEEGLAEIHDAVCADRRVVQHRLDRLGPNIAETVDSAGESHVVALVSGLERMSAEQREHVQTSMNLLRDTLGKHPAAVVLWIPIEIADEFRRFCADLFHWRALTIYVDGPERDERRLRHEYLVALATATLSPPMPMGSPPPPDIPVSAVGGLNVRVASEAAPRALDAWLDEVKRGLLRGPGGSGKTTALRRYAARRADELLDDDAEAELPVFVPALWLESRTLDWEMLARAAIPTLDDEARSWLARRLASGPAFLLIDGIDELPVYARRLLFGAGLFALIAQNPRLRIVVTTRGSDAVLGEWEEAEVLPLDHVAVSAWLNRVGYDPVDFLDALTSAGAEELTSTPLLLQIVGRRPHSGHFDLTSLLTDIVDSELGSWDFQRGVVLRTPHPRAKIRAELAQFAAHLSRNQRVSEDSDHLTAEMVDALDFVAERTSIVWREGDKFGFIHKIFQDYFSGLWLAEQEPTPDGLANYAADPAWQLPTLHALGFLSPRDLQPAVECIWEASGREPTPTRWAMRVLVLRATWARRDPDLRKRFIELAKDALRQARRDAEPPELWAPVVDLVERMEANAG